LTRTDAVELPDSFLRPDGSLSEGPQDRAEAVRSYFEALGAPAPAPPDSVPPPDLAGPPTVLNLSATERAASINEPLRPGEVHQAISCLKNGSAPGPDGILNELVKRGGLDLEKCLFSLLESAWKSELWPCWNQGTTTVLHKKGETDNLENYRGITLLNSFSKVGEYVLKGRLTPYVEEAPALSDFQGGFRPDRRCSDLHFALLPRVEKSVSRLLWHSLMLGKHTIRCGPRACGQRWLV
jgi:hypothetical protein